MTDAQRQFETIRVQQRGHVGLIVLNRPQALNALSSLLTTELLVALDGLKTMMASAASSSPAPNGPSPPAPTFARWYP